MLILGIHFGHGAAAAIVVDGKVVATIEEEKLTREKGYIGFPFRSVEYVLGKCSIDINGVDCVALGSKNIAEFVYHFTNLTRHVFKRQDFVSLKFCRALDIIHFLLPKWNTSPLLENLFFHYLKSMVGIPRDKVRVVNHHLAHAASAYYCSPWKDAVVITADGKGDGLCGSVHVGSGSQLNCIDRVSDRYSVGQFYQAVTKYLGYKVNRHEGKITGLAAYGNSSKTLEKMRKVLGFDENGSMYNRFYNDPLLEQDPIDYYKREVEDRSYISPTYVRLLNGELRKYGIVHQLYQNFIKEEMGGDTPEDLAAGIQDLAEEFIATYARKQLTDRLPAKVCLAGGVFANVKVNQKIREIEGVEGLYVQPAMDDAGCALGAALYIAAESGDYKANGETVFPSVYQGPDYSDAQIEQALADSGISFRRPDKLENEIAELLSQGLVIGRFDGRLEWGPRALGNRSILVQPTDKSINDVLNQRLKRTEFMPFAPAILGEYADEYLVGYRDTDIAARYMTVTYEIVPEKVDSIAAAVHIDGTARPQLVFAQDNPTFHEIISAYHSISGIPALVNTSFNMHEEPIVDTPQDAIRSYNVGAVDVLSMGPFLVGPD